MRLIGADELSMSKFHPVPYTHITPKDADAESYKRGWNDALDAVADNAPTIDPVRHGRWEIESGLAVCSICGKTPSEVYIDGSEKWNYCPNCGARMDGGTEWA